MIELDDKRFFWKLLIVSTISILGLVLVGIPFFSSMSFVAAVIGEFNYTSLLCIFIFMNIVGQIPIANVYMKIVDVKIVEDRSYREESDEEESSEEKEQKLHLQSLVALDALLVLAVIGNCFHPFFTILIVYTLYSYLKGYKEVYLYYFGFDPASYTLCVVPLVLMIAYITMSIIFFTCPAAALAVGIELSSHQYVLAASLLAFGLRSAFESYRSVKHVKKEKETMNNTNTPNNIYKYYYYGGEFLTRPRTANKTEQTNKQENNPSLLTV